MTEVEALTYLFKHFFANVVSDHTSASTLVACIKDPIAAAVALNAKVEALVAAKATGATVNETAATN